MLSVLICILSFVSLRRTAAGSDVAEDVKAVPMFDPTDDSCTTHPPLDTVADDHCTPDCTGPVIEVKYENFPDVKIEIHDENNMEYQDISVKVSTRCSYFYHAMHVHFAQCSCCDLLWKCILGCHMLFTTYLCDRFLLLSGTQNLVSQL